MSEAGSQHHAGRTDGDRFTFAMGDFEAVFPRDRNYATNADYSGYERWDNEAAFMAHLESMGPFFPRMPDLWTTEQIVVLSPLPDTIETMLRQFNATIADTNVSKHID